MDNDLVTTPSGAVVSQREYDMISAAHAEFVESTGQRLSLQRYANEHYFAEEEQEAGAGASNFAVPVDSALRGVADVLPSGIDRAGAAMPKLERVAVGRGMPALEPLGRQQEDDDEEVVVRTIPAIIRGRRRRGGQGGMPALEPLGSPLSSPKLRMPALERVASPAVAFARMPALQRIAPVASCFDSDSDSDSETDLPIIAADGPFVKSAALGRSLAAARARMPEFERAATAAARASPSRSRRVGVITAGDTEDLYADPGGDHTDAVFADAVGAAPLDLVGETYARYAMARLGQDFVRSQEVLAAAVASPGAMQRFARELTSALADVERAGRVADRRDGVLDAGKVNAALARDKTRFVLAAGLMRDSVRRNSADLAQFAPVGLPRPGIIFKRGLGASWIAYTKAVMKEFVNLDAWNTRHRAFHASFQGLIGKVLLTKLSAGDFGPFHDALAILGDEMLRRATVALKSSANEDAGNAADEVKEAVRQALEGPFLSSAAAGAGSPTIGAIWDRFTGAGKVKLGIVSFAKKSAKQRTPGEQEAYAKRKARSVVDKVLGEYQASMSGEWYVVDDDADMTSVSGVFYTAIGGHLMLMASINNLRTPEDREAFATDKVKPVYDFLSDYLR